MQKPHIKKLKKCYLCRHKKANPQPKRCKCVCHQTPKNESREIISLEKVGIIPKTFCPDCKINYEKEYDFCIQCNRNLIRKYETKKKQYFDSMGKIESMMHKRATDEWNKRKQKEDEISHIYQLSKTRARYSFGVKSRKFWDKKATEKLVHKFAMDEVHRHLGHKWSPWERKWLR